MYGIILASTISISFVALVALFLFRAWELKQGRVVVRNTESDPLAPRVYEARHVIRRGVYALLRLVFIVLHKIWKVAKRIGNRYVGVERMKNAVLGRKKIEEQNGSSLYLKDISTHKQKTVQKSDTSLDADVTQER